jgi:hypothetical protein
MKSGNEPQPRAEPNQPWIARTWWSPDPTVTYELATLPPG